MAKNRVTVSAPATRVRTTRVRQVESLNEAPATETKTDPSAEEEKVTVIIPVDFRLTLDNGSEVHYKAGVDEMPVSHVNHWWSKAQGVQPHNPDATEE